MKSTSEAVAYYLRSRLKKHIKDCSEDEILIFKRMYSHKDLDRKVNDVIDLIPEEKLQHALQQVINKAAQKHIERFGYE